MALHPGKLTGRIRSSGLQTRFLLGLASILLVFCILLATLIYRFEQKSLEQEAFQQTEMVMAAVNATRQYVREVLRPLMYEVAGAEVFVLEAMSTSYVSRAVMDRFNQSLPAFEYRRVAHNARNPNYEANEVESGVIRYFAEHPEEQEWQGIVTQAGKAYFMRYQPVRFQESCLSCHGRPADAPREVIELYGNERGFHQQIGAPQGLVSVGIPVDVSLLRSKEIAWAVFGGAVLATFLLFGVICFFFNKVVVQSLRDLLEVFRSSLRDEKDQTLFEQAESINEIEELHGLAQMVAEHQRTARKKLEEYALNLETMVAERTAALQESENLLKQKVADRNRELHGLNTIAELITQAVDLTEILPQVMRQTLQLIPAQGAGCYLYNHSSARLELQYQQEAPQLPAILEIGTPEAFSLAVDPAEFALSAKEAACGHMSFYGNDLQMIQGLQVPLCCRNEVLGVLTFIGVDFQEINAETQELLFSIGRQIGITIESLQNMMRLLQSKQLLQTVFNGITDLVILLDGQCRIKMVNRAFRERYGLPFAALLERRCDELQGPACPFTACRELVGAGLKSAATRTVELESGEIFQVHFYPIFDQAGMVQHTVCYGKDITEQKRVEQQAQQSEKLVALGQLAAGVAHEINNPLGVILCHLDLLAGQLEQRPEELADLKTIEKHTLSCQRIVADLLNFARGHEQVRQLASVNQIMAEVTGLVATQFRNQQIGVEIEPAPELPLLEVDVDRIKQVLLNLLMNGAQAMTGPGVLRLASRLSEDGKQVVTTVEDNGCGIPREQLDKIFDPFFTTKQPGQGTGLGLSVSYGIIREHGGKIRVASQPGEWTRFTIELPIEPEQESKNDA